MLVLMQQNNFNISFTEFRISFVVKKFFETYNKPRMILALIAVNDNNLL